MGDFKRMEQLLRMDIAFVDFMSRQARQQQVHAYEQRISALSSAKAALEEQPLYRIDVKKMRGAKRLCDINGWTEEDAAHFIEEFRARKSAAAPSQAAAARGTPRGSIVSSLSTLGRAITLA